MLSMQPQALRPRAGVASGQDRQDRRRDFASRAARPQARRTAGLLNGSGADALKMKTAAGFARERKVLRSWNGSSTSTGSKDCSSLRAHPGMSHCVAIGWSAAGMRFQTGDGRRLPQHLKAQVCRELDRLELLLRADQGCVEAVVRTRCSTQNKPKRRPPPPMLLGVHGVGPEFASVLWSGGNSPEHFDNRRQVAAYAGLAPTPWQSGSGQSRAGHLAIGQLGDYGQR